MALVQLPADLLRVAHGLQGLGGGLLPGQAVLRQGGGAVLPVGGELGPDGGVVGAEADEAAHLVAELPDGAAGELRRGHQARAGVVPARMALTVWENSTHSSFFSSSRRRPLLVMW